MKPKKPFMIMMGDDYVVIRFHVPGKPVARFVDWDGDRYSTKEEAQINIDDFEATFPGKLAGAVIIEVIDEIRTSSRA